MKASLTKQAGQLGLVAGIGILAYLLSFFPVLFLLQQAEKAGILESNGPVETAVFAFYSPILLLDGPLLERMARAFGIH